MSLVAGHEMAHRKKNKFDLFIGNWLLAFSCDCNFAIEHVYGHHKNVCLPEDPASSKRGENIYAFILRGIKLWGIDSIVVSKKSYARRVIPEDYQQLSTWIHS